MDEFESWVAVPDFPNYEVSNQGRVRNCHTMQLKNLRPTPRGYARVNLRRDGKIYSFFVHRLVARAFIGPVPTGMQVRHGPSGKADNRAVNLCYGTPAENYADMIRDGTAYVRSQPGERNGRAKLTQIQVWQIRQRYAAGGISQYTLAAEYGVARSTIGDITLGRRWKEV